MTTTPGEILWDQPGKRFFETGVDQGALYLRNATTGAYDKGFPWNGLVTVTESPSGAESNPQYADNMKYVDILSAEQFSATIEALTYPDEFERCDGTAEVVPGVTIAQQNRETFGLSYRSLLGNDVQGTNFGYKRHLVYGGLAAPSEKARATVNDSPEPITFSWEVSTTPVLVGTFAGKVYKPTAHLTLNSTKLDVADLEALEDILFGRDGQAPRLPLPAEVFTIVGATP